MFPSQNVNNSNEDYKGHSKGQVTLEAFKNKDFLVSFISRKTQQLTTAIYLVTDTIERSDPLRKYIRKITVSLLGTSCDLVSGNVLDKAEILLDIETLFKDLLVFLRTAKDTGLISEMNSEILLSEIQKCLDAIFTYRENEVTKLLKRDEKMVASFLMDQVFSEEDLPKYLPEEEILSKKDTITQNDTKDRNVVYRENKLPSSVSKNDIAIKHLRRKTILNIIKDKGEVSINDIKGVVNDVSEKTLQREINGLIDEGIVSKKGEKRWARYSIKDNK